MEEKDVKTGKYIRWISNRRFNSWNTYGKIIKVKGDSVFIQTFDDMKITEISMHGDAMSEEIFEVSLEEALNYLEKGLIKIEADIKLKELEHKKEMLKLKNNLFDIQTLLQNHAITPM